MRKLLDDRKITNLIDSSYELTLKPEELAVKKVFTYRMYERITYVGILAAMITYFVYVIFNNPVSIGSYLLGLLALGLLFILRGEVLFKDKIIISKTGIQVNAELCHWPEIDQIYLVETSGDNPHPEIVVVLNSGKRIEMSMEKFSFTKGKLKGYINSYRYLSLK